MDNLYDVIVVGGGPSGLTAALYLARARYRVLVLEKEGFGGQIKITSEVVNYPGIEKIDGHSLTENMRRQAESFGAEFMLTEAQSLHLDGDIKRIRTQKGELKAFGVLMATGAYPRMVGFKGEAEYKGHGVAYCATCDGEFFTGKDVFVVGGGYAAAEESVFLTRYARHVTMLIREEDFMCDKATADICRNHEKITVHYNVEIEEAAGDSLLRTLRYRNNVTGEITEYKASENDSFGIFVFAGYQPETGLVKDMVQLTERGYIWTDASKKTSVEGIYASGDVCDKPLRQVVTAVGDGALAATELEKYASLMHKKTGLVPTPAKGIDRGAPMPESIHKKKEPSGDTLFTPEILQQLNTVFSRMEGRLILQICPDDRPVSRELTHYMEEMAKLTDKLSLVADTTLSVERPCVRVLREDGSYSGMSFHGAPGGHEFTSFVLGLYNIAGPGQPIDGDLKSRVQKYGKDTAIRILVSLSCTNCPDLVAAAWRIGSLNDRVTVDTYDINHFGELKDRFQVMSVPCMVINDDTVAFGKKNIEQIMDLLEKA